MQPAAEPAPLQEWKKNLLIKKQKADDSELERLRQENAAKEARWIGVPAWKRLIIEKKEAASR